MCISNQFFWLKPIAKSRYKLRNILTFTLVFTVMLLNLSVNRGHRMEYETNHRNS